MKQNTDNYGGFKAEPQSLRLRFVWEAYKLRGFVLQPFHHIRAGSSNIKSMMNNTTMVASSSSMYRLS